MQEHMIGSGVWVKTHFYREGHMLHATTYCVAAGEPEIIKLSVDMRPIARAVKKYHDKLHEAARHNPDPHAAAQVGSFWSSITKPFRGIGHAVAAIAKSKLVHMVAGAVSGIVKKAVSITKTLSPINFVGHLLKGERIDHAFLHDLKEKLHAAPDVASVMAYIPGVGTGISGAVHFAAALAEGHSITDATIEAARGAFPGAVQFAFDAAKQIAKGKNVLKSTLEAARMQIPAEARKAFDAGFAFVHGQSLQKSLAQAASSAMPSVMPGLEKFSGSALAAFATAHHAFDTIAKARQAVNAVEKVAAATALIAKANNAAKRVGTDKSKTTLRAHPAFAHRLRMAELVVKASRELSHDAVAKAKAEGAMAMNAIVALYKTAKNDPDPEKRSAAAKSIQIMEIVASHRSHVQAETATHTGGIPGIHIDSRGRLVQGRYVPSHGKHDSFLYSPHGGGHGSWRRIDKEHKAAAGHHEALALAHHAKAEATPSSAPEHRQIAAHHATQALRHKKAARVAGTIIGATTPGLIGCHC
jgi:hypothetical protein